MTFARRARGLGLVAAATVALTLAVSSGCGDSGSSNQGGAGGEGGAGGADPRVYPEGDGTIASEAAACEDLYDTLLDKANTLSCVSTLQSCPSLIQKLGPTSACSQYDAGSVAGCVSYFAEATDCEELASRADNCVPEAIPDSVPLGCPEG